MKELPRRLGSEVWLPLDYCAVRFMHSKTMLGLRQGDPTGLFTLKLTRTGTLLPQLQGHLRFSGYNLEGSMDILDIDFYLPQSILPGLCGSLDSLKRPRFGLSDLAYYLGDGT